VIEDLHEAGIKDIAIVLGDIHPEKVIEYYGNGEAFNVNITYIQQGEPKGIAHAVGLCEKFVDDNSFVVYLGDNLLKGGIIKFIEDFGNSKHDALILLCKVKNPECFGVAQFDTAGKLVQLIEKPKKPPSEYALTGIYFFRPLIFETIRGLKPSSRGELEITEAIQFLLEKGFDVSYRFVKGWWKDTGTSEDILESNRLILDELEHEVKGVIENEASIQGRVMIGKETTIKHGALLRGPIIIGENTTVEGRVYIGPYTSIGNNVVIKRGEIENSIIMDNCYIDAEEKIIDSIMGPNSTIQSNQNGPKGRKFIIGESSIVTM
jgi:glucose-1-phosphate thymidylyltransferase